MQSQIDKFHCIYLQMTRTIALPLDDPKINDPCTKKIFCQSRKVTNNRYSYQQNLLYNNHSTVSIHT